MHVGETISIMSHLPKIKKKGYFGITGKVLTQQLSVSFGSGAEQGSVWKLLCFLQGLCPHTKSRALTAPWNHLNLPAHPGTSSSEKDSWLGPCSPSNHKKQKSKSGMNLLIINYHQANHNLRYCRNILNYNRM